LTICYLIVWHVGHGQRADECGIEGWCHVAVLGQVTYNLLGVFQAQKELLDTELDLYKKGQAGEDIALLKIKYTQLQIEVQHHNAHANPATDRGTAP